MKEEAYMHPLNIQQADARTGAFSNFVIGMEMDNE